MLKNAYGIDDIYYLYGSTIVFGTVSSAIGFLPIMALFARIIPKKIEATMFAFLTGVWNLSTTIISTQLGYYINVRFFNVTGENLQNYEKLCLVSLIFSFLPFLILGFIPTEEEITGW